MPVKGNAKRGTTLAFGSFGLKALDTVHMTERQIEAARQANMGSAIVVDIKLNDPSPAVDMRGCRRFHMTSFFRPVYDRVAGDEQ